MSKKVLELVKLADAVTSKTEKTLDLLIKGATNADSPLSVGEEACAMIYEMILQLRKKGGKGDTIGDYKHPEITKAMKGLEQVAKQAKDAVNKYNDLVPTLQTCGKALRQLSGQLAPLSREKDIARNPAAVKLLIEAGKKLIDAEAAIDASSIGTMSTAPIKRITISSKTKVEDLRGGLRKALQEAADGWKEAETSSKTAKRKFREQNYDATMKAVVKLVA